MRKLLASIEKKNLVARPELAALVSEVMEKNTAFEQSKAQKDAAKTALKLAKKALKKQLKRKPAKAVVAEKAPKPTAKPKSAAAPRTKKSATKKVDEKAVTA